jgi:protoporphyrinogen oxidase
MGRFFPHADLTDIIRNMKVANNASYNATFTYPEGGAIEYVKAIASAVRPGGIALGEALVGVDLDRKVARTTKREIAFERLVSSAPFDRLLALAKVPHDDAVFSWNKVLVFNLGFDKKGQRDIHWMYFPDPTVAFYRIGFYDNIFDADRLSLYVEIGYPKGGTVDVAAARERVLADLRREGVITDHRLVAEHSVVMDPAYVHITKASNAAYASISADLAKRGVHSVGRYGRWTYCSIEDNIVEARELVASFRA